MIHPPRTSSHSRSEPKYGHPKYDHPSVTRPRPPAEDLGTEPSGLAVGVRGVLAEDAMKRKPLQGWHSCSLLPPAMGDSLMMVALHEGHAVAICRLAVAVDQASLRLLGSILSSVCCEDVSGVGAVWRGGEWRQERAASHCTRLAALHTELCVSHERTTPVSAPHPTIS